MKAMFSIAQITEMVSNGKTDLAALVEAVFIAQGYQMRVSPFGNDGSVEMLADGKVGPFGFVLPRIAVLVKSGRELADPDSDYIEMFLGCSGAWQGLFVSPSGFTAGAKKEAGRLFHQGKVLGAKACR
jgi:predicted Mrr-cat superfamily restriction endonuclease